VSVTRHLGLVKRESRVKALELLELEDRFTIK
jgi:hypothetical protein